MVKDKQVIVYVSRPFRGCWLRIRIWILPVILFFFFCPSHPFCFDWSNHPNEIKTHKRYTRFYTILFREQTLSVGKRLNVFVEVVVSKQVCQYLHDTKLHIPLSRSTDNIVCTSSFWWRGEGWWQITGLPIFKELVWFTYKVSGVMWSGSECEHCWSIEGWIHSKRGGIHSIRN